MTFGPLDYADPKPPEMYRCSVCERTGCKLWREFQSAVREGWFVAARLRCCDCVAKVTRLDMSRIDAQGRVPMRDGRDITRTTQLGWWVPAIPTADGKDFHEKTVPEANAWWTRLPTRPPVDDPSRTP